MKNIMLSVLMFTGFSGAVVAQVPGLVLQPPQPVQIRPFNNYTYNPRPYIPAPYYGFGFNYQFRFNYYYNPYPNYYNYPYYNPNYNPFWMNIR